MDPISSASAAKNFVERHFSSLEEALKPIRTNGEAKIKDPKKEMSNALEYQMAKNLDWIKNNVDPEYQLPNGWDWGRVNSIINSAVGKPHYQRFVSSFRNLTQEWRDTMLDYGLVTKEVHELLGKNPFYIPLQRDLSQVLDNIDVGLKTGRGSTRRGAGTGILHKLSGGDVETFFKNPLETVVDKSFTLYKNAYKNDTGQQALRIAEMDTDGMFAKKISKKQYEEGGGIEVLTGGKKQYVRLQDDLKKIIDENEQVLDLGKLGEVTRLFASLKTRSLEYQSAALVRDLGSSFVNSQITNPFRYVGEVFKAIKNKNANVKEVGGYFDRAYNDHTGGVDPKQVLKEFQKKAGNVKAFDAKSKESWKELAGVLGKYLDMPFKPAKALGQITDVIPREIEVREAERLFMKKHGPEIEAARTDLASIDNQLTQLQAITDPMDPRLQGIDALTSQKEQLEGQLRQFQQDLRREQIYRGRDVIDYSRSGRGKVAKQIRQYVIFANTTTQSKDKLIRSFIERPGATIAKATMVMSPLVAAQQIAHESMSAEDESVYNGLPDYIKQYNYVFVDGGNVYAVPKLHELALLSNPIEAALKGESLSDSGQLVAKEALPYQAGNLLQGLVPNGDGSITPVANAQIPSTVFSPLIDTVANKKIGFNQKPVSFGAHWQGEDAPANDWTLEMFRELLGDNPNADRAQYVIEQYLGDYGKYGTRAANAAINPSEDALTELMRSINPAQDRAYLENSRWFRPPLQETKTK
jgi:hypothetical protein